MKFRNVFLRYYAPEVGDEGTRTGGQAPAPEKTDEEVSEKDEGEKDEGEKKPESKLSDSEAKLLSDLMKHKQGRKEAEAQAQSLRAELDKFKGINLEEVQAMLAERRQNEERKLAEQGNWDALKSQMLEQHTVQLDTVKSELQSLAAERDGLKRQIEEMSIGGAFTGSKFISDELVLTPAKARVIYGGHFDVVDGAVVAFDKPRGTEGRTQLVDAAGEPLGFDAALRKLIDKDPERDHMLRSKAKPGAQSGSEKVAGAAGRQSKAGMTGVDRIAAGLAALQAQ